MLWVLGYVLATSFSNESSSQVFSYYDMNKYKASSQVAAHFKDDLLVKLIRRDLEFKPWVHDLALDDLFNATLDNLGFGGKNAGVALVLAPKGSGKSSHAMKVVDKVQDRYGGVLVWEIFNMEEANKAGFFKYITAGVQDAADQWSLQELLPTNEKPLLIVVDQIDVYQEELGDFMLTLAKMSHNDKQILVLAICSNKEAAADLLRQNGGTKIWTLQDDDGNIEGNALATEEWSKRGLKLSEAQVEYLLSWYETENDSVLDPVTKRRFIEAAVRAGKLSYIRDNVHKLFKYTGHVDFHTLEMDSKKSVQEWEDLKGVLTRKAQLMNMPGRDADVFQRITWLMNCPFSNCAFTDVVTMFNL